MPQTSTKQPVFGTAGTALWESVTAVLTFADPRETHALSMACQLADDVARLRDELTDTKLIVQGSTGQPVENPLLGAIRNATALQSRLLGSIAVPTDQASRSHAGRALVAQRWAS